jgi:hypothetical protein
MDHHLSLLLLPPLDAAQAVGLLRRRAFCELAGGVLEFPFVALAASNVHHGFPLVCRPEPGPAAGV